MQSALFVHLRRGLFSIEPSLFLQLAALFRKVTAPAKDTANTITAPKEDTSPIVGLSSLWVKSEARLPLRDIDAKCRSCDYFYDHLLSGHRKRTFFHVQADAKINRSTADTVKLCRITRISSGSNDKHHRSIHLRGVNGRHRPTHLMCIFTTLRNELSRSLALIVAVRVTVDG